MLGCGMMTTSIPTMITAGVTGSLPGASDYKAAGSAWGQHHLPLGRVLLSNDASAAPGGEPSFVHIRFFIASQVT